MDRLVLQAMQGERLTAWKALHSATLGSATALGLAGEIGSLAAGKQADLVLISAGDLNMQPVHDLISTVVMQTSLANIESVMVAGRWKKRAGRLLDVDLPPKLEALGASGERITRAMAAA